MVLTGVVRFSYESSWFISRTRAYTYWSGRANECLLSHVLGDGDIDIELLIIARILEILRICCTPGVICLSCPPYTVCEGLVRASADGSHRPGFTGRRTARTAGSYGVGRTGVPPGPPRGTDCTASESTTDAISYPRTGRSHHLAPVMGTALPPSSGLAKQGTREGRVYRLLGTVPDHVTGPTARHILRALVERGGERC